MNSSKVSSRLAKIERTLIISSVALLCLTFVLPLWRIEIFAPQYPEGLMMKIGLSQISGNVEQINILNHYIGMKRIAADSIPELRIMPAAVAVLVAMGGLAFAINRRWFTALWAAILVGGASAGLLDFYLWGHDYGHNLDPNAPIKIPGMSYQPPLIGHKTLLNIDSYSLPDWGGIALAMALLLAVTAVFWKKITLLRPGLMVLAIAGLGMTGTGCNSTPEPIEIGVDSCASCRMQISDARHGGEIITEKRKVHKFDSIECLMKFQSDSRKEAHQVLVSDYFSGTLVAAKEAHFLRSDRIKAPMGSQLIASKDGAQLEKLGETLTGMQLNWSQVSGIRSPHP